MEETRVHPTGKPLQLVSWSEKQSKKQEWFKNNVDYGIASSNFGSPGQGEQDLDMLYEVYNNKFPLKWFSHITDPLNAQDAKHKSFPAKVRPVTILRTNLDLLMAEYPRRPFIYQVNNMGDDGYSKYMEELNQLVVSNAQQYFKLALQQQLAEQGMIDENGQPVSEEAAQSIQQAMENIQYPEQIQEEFQGSYRDKEAVIAQKWLKRALREHGIRPKFQKMFKDWLIAGQCYSYKSVKFDNLVYERISPKMIRYIKSPESEYVEDSELITVKRMLTVSDVVDMFYDELKEKDLEYLENQTTFASPSNFQAYLGGYSNDSGMVPVWHVQWKGKKKIGFMTYFNEESMAMETIEVDEDYKAQEGQTIEWKRVNEAYEGWRIHDKIYVGMGALPIQRNAMNNFSTCKLSYNGKRYSDTEATNISVLEIGLPFQIMYIITNRTLELTIAKSKGKIMLIDQAAIPNTQGWNDEKFFYYAEALGYALLNRNQIGVDKSWNQYQVLDMTLFESISQLIELQNYFKQQWDDIIGINRQRKGQTYASDAVGVNERATFQSTVITDMIFNTFEEFTQTELQGFLDLSKFTNASGLRKIWYDTEMGNQILNINPGTYCTSEFGIFLDSASEAIAAKNKIEGQVTAMLQNSVRPSTILEILTKDNISELKQKLKQIEEIQDKLEASQASGEQQAAADADERKKAFMEYEKMLDTKYMNDEYDRKEDIEYIRGDFSTFTFQDGDSNDNGVPDAQEVEKNQLARDKFTAEQNNKTADRNDKMLERQDRKEKEAKDFEIKKEEIAIKRKAANKKPSK